MTLAVDNLRVYYRTLKGDVQALDGVSFSIADGEIMGLAGSLGSIEPGKTANLVITDGDLLEARTHIRHLFINGRQVPLNSRHTELYEQFRNRK